MKQFNLLPPILNVRDISIVLLRKKQHQAHNHQCNKLTVTFVSKTAYCHICGEHFPIKNINKYFNKQRIYLKDLQS